MSSLLRLYLFIALMGISALAVPGSMAAPTSTPPDNSNVNPVFSNVVVNESLEVGQGVVVGASISVGGDLNVTGGVNVSGFSSLNNAEFAGSVLFMDDVHIDNSLDIDSGLEVDNEATFNDSATFNEEVVINGNLTVNGEINGQSSGGQTSTSTGLNSGEPTSDDLTVEGQLFVEGQGNFSSDVIINKQLSVNEQANFSKDANVSGKLVVNQEATLNQGAIVTGQLTVNGPSSFSQPAYVNGVGSAAIIALTENPESDQGGLWGGISQSGTSIGTWLGYNDSSTGSFYSLFTTGITKVGSLIADSGIFTDSITSTSGTLSINGGVTATDFGHFYMASNSLSSGSGTVVSQGCSNGGFMIACSGYYTAGSAKSTYKGAYPENGQCNAVRSDTTGTLTVYAYCFDPTQLAQ